MTIQRPTNLLIACTSKIKVFFIRGRTLILIIGTPGNRRLKSTVPAAARYLPLVDTQLQVFWWSQSIESAAEINRWLRDEVPNSGRWVARVTHDVYRLLKKLPDEIYGVRKTDNAFSVRFVVGRQITDVRATHRSTAGGNHCLGRVERQILPRRTCRRTAGDSMRRRLRCTTDVWQTVAIFPSVPIFIGNLFLNAGYVSEIRNWVTRILNALYVRNAFLNFRSVSVLG